MLLETRFPIGRAPILMISDGPAAEAARRGTVLFAHGFTADCEINRKEIESLAGAGFLAIGIDNYGHGRRSTPEWDHLFSRTHPGFERNLHDAVIETARDVPTIIDHLEEKGLIHEGRVGITGISMGGHISYLAVTMEPRLRACVPIIGAPRWRIDDPREPVHHPKAFASVALLAMNAGRDDVVEARHAREFHAKLMQLYPALADRIRYAEWPDSGHMMREQDWEECWAMGLGWLATHLRKPTEV